MTDITQSDIQACKELVDWWNTGTLAQDGELRRQAVENKRFPDDVRRAEMDLVGRLIRWVAEGGTEPKTHTAYAVIQEGGSSVEAYLHVSSTEGEAQAFKDDCEEGAYRTSGIAHIGLDQHGRMDMSDAEDLIQIAASRDYD